MFSEHFRRFVVMFFRTFGMRMGEDRVMRSLFVLAVFVMLRRLAMVFGGFFVMFSGGGMMLGGFLGVRH
jgi:hypothetical protein